MVWTAQNSTEYDKNLDKASDLYLNGNKIPESILIQLVPNNYDEMSRYYDTTSPEHQLGKTDFFYQTSQMIFDQVILNNNADFYLPSLRLASFADGEYGEGFTDNLELIINMNTQKFCDSIVGKDYVNRNPINYYAELYNCK
jgi:hypothetical protein